MKTEGTNQILGIANWTAQILYPAIRIIVNLALFAIFMKEASIIRGDGPGGFVEVLIKGLAMLITLPIFLLSIASVFQTSNGAKNRFKVNKGYVISTTWLAIFAALAILEACSDDKGYCRSWGIFLPN